MIDLGNVNIVSKFIILSCEHARACVRRYTDRQAGQRIKNGKFLFFFFLFFLGRCKLVSVEYWGHLTIVTMVMHLIYAPYVTEESKIKLEKMLLELV